MLYLKLDRSAAHKNMDTDGGILGLSGRIVMLAGRGWSFLGVKRSAMTGANSMVEFTSNNSFVPKLKHTTLLVYHHNDLQVLAGERE